MAKPAETTEVAVRENAAPPMVIDFGNVGNDGFEDADKDSFAIPFLRILQAMSPQVKKSESAYIKGAEEGDIFNTVTGVVIKPEEGLTIIPCAYEHTYLLWAPGRAGLRGRLAPSEYAATKKHIAINDKGKKYEADEDGNIITDTRQHYVLIVDDNGATQPALISMSSSQIKKSKNWWSQQQAICMGKGKKPIYSQLWKLTTVTDPPNNEGTWMGWKIVHAGQITDPEVYLAAKSFREMVKDGTAQAATHAGDEDVPF